MSLTPAGEKKTFINVQGKVEENNVCFRQVVPEGTPGAKLRKYETSDGTKGEKWELWYKEVGGRIVNVHFYDGDYGKNLIITIDAGLEEPVELSLGVQTKYGEDLLRKLPNIDFNKDVVLSPYGFESEGRTLQGMTVQQDGAKLANAYTKKNEDGTFEYMLDMPEPADDTKDSDDWKMYFMQARKHMINYTEENIVSQFMSEANAVAEPEEEEEF